MIRLALAVLTLLLAAFSPARAERVNWYNAGYKNIGTNSNCIIGNTEIMTAAYAGYSVFGNTPWVATQQVFYTHLIVTQLGNTCVPNAVVIDFNLPAGLELAVSATDPVFCFGLFPGSSSDPRRRLANYANDPDYGCPQNFPLGTFGYQLSAPRGGWSGGTWGMMQGVWLEFMIPVRATRILAANAQVGFRVNPRLGVYDTVSTPAILGNGERIFRSSLVVIELPVELCQLQGPILGC